MRNPGYATATQYVMDKLIIFQRTCTVENAPDQRRR